MKAQLLHVFILSSGVHTRMARMKTMVYDVSIKNMLLFWLVILMMPANGLADKLADPSVSSITIRLNQATALMNAGKSDQALALLAPLENELAGNSDFDYLLGIAALESGHPVKASLALERVITMRPGFVGARVDLGRAYYAIGNYQQARQEFKTVLKQPDPPALVKTVVNKYMALIAKQLSKTDTRLTGWFEISGGYDGNVNFATADEVIQIPVLQSTSVTLSKDNVEQDDIYLKGSVNFGVLHQFTPSVRSFFGAYGSKRLLSNEKQFENDDAKIQSYVEFGEKANTIRVGANADTSFLDESENSRQAGGNMTWQHQFNTDNLVSVFGQYDSFRYPEVEINNFDQWIGGMSWTRSVSFISKFIFVSNAYGGYAFETDNRANGDNSIYGLRFGSHMKPAPGISMLAGIGSQLNQYKKENIVFQDTREDQQVDARLALYWTPVNSIAVGGMISYIHNKSTISIYEYERNDVSAMLRYYFF